jgi:Restriction endonuclease
MSGVINVPSHKRLNILLSGKPDLLSALLPPDGRIRMSVQIGPLKIPFSFRYQTIEPLIRPLLGGLNESELQEIFFPSDDNDLQAVPETQPIILPGLETSSTGISVGVFGEDSAPARVEVVSRVAGDLVARILRSPEDIYRLTPGQFEELIMDRIAAMGYEVKQVGKTTQPDGGIDFVFWPPPGRGLPFLGAVQAKHHTKPSLKCGVEVVHSMAGVLERHRAVFNLGIIVTNTSFTNEAEWFVNPMQFYLRLRDGADVQRWVEGDFANQKEQREFPTSIQLTSKLILDLRR